MSTHPDLENKRIKQKRKNNTLRRIIGYIASYWQLKAVLVLVVLTNIMSILSPAIIGGIIDIVGDISAGREIQGGTQIFGFIYSIMNPISEWITITFGLIRNQSTLLVFSLSLVLISIITGLFNYFMRYASAIISQKGSFIIRSDLYDSLLEQSFSFYDKQRTGQLMARATADIRQLERFFNFGFRMLISSGLLIVLTVYSLVSIDLRLTLISGAIFPLLMFSFWNFGTKITPLFEKTREQYGIITSVLQENLSGIRVVRGFSQEEAEERKFSEECEEYFDVNIQVGKLRAFHLPLATFMSGLGFVLIIWFGGNLIIENTFTVGSMVAFYFYLTRLMRPIRMSGMIASMIVRATTAAKRVFEIIDAEVGVSDKHGALNLERIEGKIVFEDVWFSYDKENMVLKNIKLEAKPGDTIAILGATGSGKSSIINLVPRFYDVTKGSIRIDGTDLRDIKIKSLRRHIGIVRQEPFIFSSTLKKNIEYGVDNPSSKTVREAAKRARIDEFIMSLPNGYETEVGERGVTLSGGQKQRVAIARALLKNPKILILDDSTSNVDTETEFEIQNALDELLKERTTFIITQRLSSIKRADYIIVLENGSIAEQGSHQELMEHNGIYHKLYKTQIAQSNAEKEV